jgi:2-amino-4-hydroxy-6-hydroxymethyldihydropteridine diphosphokinase
MAALSELAQLPSTELLHYSRLYRSAPLGPVDQPDYVNAVAVLDTRLDPHELLAALQALEHVHGRMRAGMRWGPRTLDLDLLVFGDLRLSSESLTVPHPGIAERDFVLRPLAEIAPALEIPGLGPVQALLKECSLRSLKDQIDT